jgi:hypothetical protein
MDGPFLPKTAFLLLIYGIHGHGLRLLFAQGTLYCSTEVPTLFDPLNRYL